MNRNIPPPIRSVNNGHPQTKSVNLIIYSLIRSNIFYIVLCLFHITFAGGLLGRGLLDPVRLVVIKAVAFCLADPLLLFQFDVFAQILVLNLSLELTQHDMVGYLGLKTVKQLELRVSFPEISHQLKRVEQ